MSANRMSSTPQEQAQAPKRRLWAIYAPMLWMLIFFCAALSPRGEDLFVADRAGAPALCAGF